MTNWIKHTRWNAEGVKPADGSTLYTKGFESGYKPPAHLFNYFFNQNMQIIDQLQQEVDTKITQEAPKIVYFSNYAEDSGAPLYVLSYFFDENGNAKESVTADIANIPLSYELQKAIESVSKGGYFVINPSFVESNGAWANIPTDKNVNYIYYCEGKGEQREHEGYTFQTYYFTLCAYETLHDNADKDLTNVKDVDFKAKAQSAGFTTGHTPIIVYGKRETNSHNYTATVEGFTNFTDGDVVVFIPDLPNNVYGEGSVQLTINNTTSVVLTTYFPDNGDGGVIDGSVAIQLIPNAPAIFIYNGEYLVHQVPTLNIQNSFGKLSSYGNGATAANGDYSLAISLNSVANGKCAMALGQGVQAQEDSSFAGNYHTYANEFQAAFGRCNKVSAGATGFSDTSGDVFIVGNGTSNTSRSNAFRTSMAGKSYGLSAFVGSGADYAEMWEIEGGNPNNEDWRGYFVTVNENNKIRKATPEDDYILGVISATPMILGDSQSEEWHGRYLRDVFGEKLIETVEVEETTDEDGNIIPAHTENRWILNPEYDSTQEYISRENRPEWAAVGLLGKLVVKQDGTCTAGKYCSVANEGIATASESGYRVLKVIDDEHIQIMFR